MRESGHTPPQVAIDAMKQRLTARVTSACEVSNLKVVHDHSPSGAAICRVITKEQNQRREAATMRCPNPEPEPAVEMVILSEDTPAKSEVIRWVREHNAKVGAWA